MEDNALKAYPSAVFAIISLNSMHHLPDEHVLS